MGHPTDIPCPTCKRQSGQWCHVNGIRRPSPHPKRVKEYHCGLRKSKDAGRVLQRQADDEVIEAPV